MCEIASRINYVKAKWTVPQSAKLNIYACGLELFFLGAAWSMTYATVR